MAFQNVLDFSCDGKFEYKRSRSTTYPNFKYKYRHIDNQQACLASGNRNKNLKNASDSRCVKLDSITSKK